MSPKTEVDHDVGAMEEEREEGRGRELREEACERRRGGERNLRGQGSFEQEQHGEKAG